MLPWFLGAINEIQIMKIPFFESTLRRTGTRAAFYNPEDGETLSAIIARGFSLLFFVLQTIFRPHRLNNQSLKPEVHQAEVQPRPAFGKP